MPRTPCDVVFNGAPISAAGSIGPSANLTVIDISAGGIRFRSRDAFRPGDEAIVEMIGRGGAPALVGLTVIHVDAPSGSDASFGARFTPLSPEVMRELMGESPADVRQHRASA
jgi:hypothetical protein